GPGVRRVGRGDTVDRVAEPHTVAVRQRYEPRLGGVAVQLGLSDLQRLLAVLVRIVDRERELPVRQVQDVRRGVAGRVTARLAFGDDVRVVVDADLFAGVAAHDVVVEDDAAASVDPYAVGVRRDDVAVDEHVGRDTGAVTVVAGVVGQADTPEAVGAVTGDRVGPHHGPRGMAHLDAHPGRRSMPADDHVVLDQRLRRADVDQHALAVALQHVAVDPVARAGSVVLRRRPAGVAQGDTRRAAADDRVSTDLVEVFVLAVQIDRIEHGPGDPVAHDEVVVGVVLRRDRVAQVRALEGVVAHDVVPRVVRVGVPVLQRRALDGHAVTGATAADAGGVAERGAADLDVAALLDP